MEAAVKHIQTLTQLMPLPDVPNELMVEVCKQELEEQVRRALTQKIEETIREQVVPEDFEVHSTAMVTAPDGGRLYCQADAQVKAEPVPNLTAQQIDQIVQEVKAETAPPTRGLPLATFVPDIHAPTGDGAAQIQYNWAYPDTTRTKIARYVGVDGAASQWVVPDYNSTDLQIAIGDYTDQITSSVTGGITWDTSATTSYTATTAAFYNYGNIVIGGDTATTYTITNTSASPYTFYMDAAGQWVSGEETKQTKLKRKIREQLQLPERKRSALAALVTPAELKARDTLRDMLSEADWRRYVTNAFIMVRGESGRWYQVFAQHNHERIRVYEKGKHIANLCIHSDSACPLSDHVIAMKIQIELDEESIWKDANTYDMNGHSSGNITINTRLGEAMAALPQDHFLYASMGA